MGCYPTEEKLVNGRGGYHGHSEVIVGPPPVVVRPPELVVRPPEVIVR